MSHGMFGWGNPQSLFSPASPGMRRVGPIQYLWRRLVRLIRNKQEEK